MLRSSGGTLRESGWGVKSACHWGHMCRQDEMIDGENCSASGDEAERKREEEGESTHVGSSGPPTGPAARDLPGAKTRTRAKPPSLLDFGTSCTSSKLLSPTAALVPRLLVQSCPRLVRFLSVLMSRLVPLASRQGPPFLAPANHSHGIANVGAGLPA